MNLRWYARRLASMSPAEMAGRARDELTRRRWRSRQVTDPGADPTGVAAVCPAFTALIPVAGDDVPEDARVRLKEAAEGLFAGRWPVFARERDDMAPAPDWFLDPDTGRRAPDRSYCFVVDHRDTAAVGNVKEDRLDGGRAVLRWRDGHGRRGATLTLPDALAWRRIEGQTDPPAGWYSPAFGARVPTVTLLGSGRIGHGPAPTTVLQLDPRTTP